ncbi:2-acylglycerol O-acyltransferase 1 [Orchesella cincta]|uniref:Acyltransferase n=1 Tax=Orchesella cincta TaxID=48709 RepID=A0A1D2NJ90_ORCCI|nr:2-acylglycerol O-acyltransferase 1 [Orchesella cincta]
MNTRLFSAMTRTLPRRVFSKLFHSNLKRFAIALAYFLMWVLPTVIFPIFLLVIFLFPPSAAVIIPYLIFCWWDRDTPHNMGRPSRAFRNLSIWRYGSNYFPVKLVKTVELEPSKNYLFCAHPHGLICNGVAYSFGSNIQRSERLFPGLNFRILTFDTTFKFPVLREYALLMGLCSASRRSMNNILGSEKKGNVAILMPGGAPEVLDAHPNAYVLQLCNKKGFIKVALENGSPLVPVFSFGENEIHSQYPNPKGSILRTVQEFIQSWIGIPPAVWYGTGFVIDFGPFPYAKPITVVVGAPIHVPKIENPTTKEIDELHSIYIDAITDLYYAHKDKYIPKSTLTIV